MSHDFETALTASQTPKLGEWSPYPPPYPRSPGPQGRNGANFEQRRSVSPAMTSDESRRVIEDHSEYDGSCADRLERFARDTTIHGVGQILRNDQPTVTRVVSNEIGCIEEYVHSTRDGKFRHQAQLVWQILKAQWPYACLIHSLF